MHLHDDEYFSAIPSTDDQPAWCVENRRAERIWGFLSEDVRELAVLPANGLSASLFARLQVWTVAVMVIRNVMSPDRLRTWGRRRPGRLKVPVGDRPLPVAWDKVSARAYFALSLPYSH